MSEKEKPTIVTGEKQKELIDQLTKVLIDFQTSNKVFIQWIPVPQFIEVKIEEEEK